MPVHRHVLTLLPALDGGHVPAEISGNLLPRVQTVGRRRDGPPPGLRGTWARPWVSTATLARAANRRIARQTAGTEATAADCPLSPPRAPDDPAGRLPGGGQRRTTTCGNHFDGCCCSRQRCSGGPGTRRTEGLQGSHPRLGSLRGPGPLQPLVPRGTAFERRGSGTSTGGSCGTRTSGREDRPTSSCRTTPGNRGDSTGWHTHPGASLIIVTQGTVTAYEGDDPDCSPHVYTAGQTFVDPGGGHVHLIRNQTNAVAKTVAVQLVPHGPMRRIDAPAPGNCPF